MGRRHNLPPERNMAYQIFEHCPLAFAQPDTGNAIRAGRHRHCDARGTPCTGRCGRPIERHSAVSLRRAEVGPGDHNGGRNRAGGRREAADGRKHAAGTILIDSGTKRTPDLAAFGLDRNCRRARPRKPPVARIAFRWQSTMLKPSHAAFGSEVRNRARPVHRHRCLLEIVDQ